MYATSKSKALDWSSLLSHTTRLPTRREVGGIVVNYFLIMFIDGCPRAPSGRGAPCFTVLPHVVSESVGGEGIDRIQPKGNSSSEDRENRQRSTLVEVWVGQPVDKRSPIKEHDLVVPGRIERDSRGGDRETARALRVLRRESQRHLLIAQNYLEIDTVH